MSTPSTPHSTRSARSMSPANNSPRILTPGQKIRAMMAQFDSDSESDSQAPNSKKSLPKLDFGSKHTSTGIRTLEKSNGFDSDSEDADEIVRPKGRMAARMQGDVDDSPDLTAAQQDSAFSRLSNSMRTEREQTQKPTRRSASPVDESSDDDLPVAAPRRKNNAQPAHSPVSADHDSTKSPSRARSVSPLFVPTRSSPEKDDAALDQTTDDETHDKGNTNARLLALIAQKRKEREERQRIEDEQKAAKRAQLEHFSSEIMSGEESEGEGATSARNLSQKARQPRKASKKALEEMRQETQRLSRNMQLAHQAQTKKKITKESLFARFNFMQPEPSPAESAPANSSSTAGSQHSSDGESPKKDKQTPQTSPVVGPTDAEKVLATDVAELPARLEEQDVNEISASPLEKTTDLVSSTLDAPKDMTIVNAKKMPRKPTQPPVRVLLSRQEVARHQQEDSDSDGLEVVTSPSKARRIAAFENLPTRKLQESSSMTTLKALAHLTSPSRKQSGMNSAELSASLLYKARQQAAKERRERLEELRAKGIVIETVEERAAMEDDIENMMEKARQEADEIARKEKAATKKGQGLDVDDDEDEDFYAPSGSDDDGSNRDDDEEEEEEEEEDDDINENPGFFDHEAGEDDDSADEQADDDHSDADVLVEASTSRRKRRARVVNDEDEEDEPQVPSTPVRPPSHDPQSVQRPVFPGMETPGGMSMGLTQAFAGTLADDGDTASQPVSSTMPLSLPDPGRPVPRLRAEDSEILVRDSQEQPHEPEFMTSYTQSVTRVSESPAAHKFSQYSQLPDPTQDQGFIYSPFDPNKRFRETPPVSTVDTVILGQSQSPIAERKSRQLRRGRAANLSMVEEDENEGDFEINANAFNIMKKAAKKKSVPFDKQKSEAKNIVDEAAEESEDEYAGLGGASDDSDGEEDAYDQQMINDQSGEVVDEKQLAAMNAMHQRDRDEKDVAKLYKDITTGALRRRRGGDDDLDLDDSDDERLARRREKQREFAKMRRALLADDKIGQLADDPKKAAFFKAIEDREVEDDFELEFLEDKAGDSQNEASQDVAQEQNDSAHDSKKRKRPLEAAGEDATNRPPPHLRRTPASAISKKPATLAEIRETLSFLTETHEYDSFHEDASIDEEEPVEAEDDSSTGNEEGFSEETGSQSKDGFVVPSHPRRTRGVVVDRLALLRQASSNSATSGPSANTKFAFHGGANSDGPIGFRPPPLLRRVNTGSSSSSGSSTTSSNANRVSQPAPSGPKKGGAINSYTAAREKEREKQLRMKQRNGSANIAKLLGKHAANGLGALAGKGQWD
ncbi:Mediator of replication checkpoint protein 1 [Penicillium rolfsii]|nr:Mediator of replication checkpoint protein 1 [Penicillium rolfsii]